MRHGHALLADRLSATADDAEWEHRLTSWPQAWAWATAMAFCTRMRDAGRDGHLQQELDETEWRLAQTTEQLAASHAWSHCLTRMTQEQRQALQSYRSAMSSLGKGTGRYAPRHRRAARDAMEIARDAVPAWIMPLQKVVETIPPTPDAFDVVIVDEASQAGIDALFLLWLAPRVIVVGDDKQCAPTFAVQEHQRIFDRLDAYLPGLRPAFRDDFKPGNTSSNVRIAGMRLMAQTRSRAVHTLPGMADAARATCSWPISSNWPKTSLAAPRSRSTGAGIAEISALAGRGGAPGATSAWTNGALGLLLPRRGGSSSPGLRGIQGWAAVPGSFCISPTMRRSACVPLPKRVLRWRSPASFAGWTGVGGPSSPPTCAGCAGPVHDRGTPPTAPGPATMPAVWSPSSAWALSTARPAGRSPDPGLIRRAVATAICCTSCGPADGRSSASAAIAGCVSTSSGVRRSSRFCALRSRRWSSPRAFSNKSTATPQLGG